MLKIKLFILLFAVTFSVLDCDAQVRNRCFNFHLKKLQANQTSLKIKVNEAKHKKSVAALLDITLGVFAVHRMYLGTSPKVPVVYTLTLGGGGFLVLTDLGIILFTKDLESYSEKNTVLMWSEK